MWDFTTPYNHMGQCLIISLSLSLSLISFSIYFYLYLSPNLYLYIPLVLFSGETWLMAKRTWLEGTESLSHLVMSFAMENTIILVTVMVEQRFLTLRLAVGWHRVSDLTFENLRKTKIGRRKKGLTKKWVQKYIIQQKRKDKILYVIERGGVRGRERKKRERKRQNGSSWGGQDYWQKYPWKDGTWCDCICIFYQVFSSPLFKTVANFPEVKLVWKVRTVP